MALDVHASFSAGELDPALHERTTLQKFKTGLATARNVYIGKSGRVISRGGRRHFIRAKYQDRQVIIHPMGAIGSFIEFGHEYIRVYTVNPDGYYGAPVDTVDYRMEEDTHGITEDQLDYVQFVDDEDGSCYIFCYGTNIGYIIANGTTSGGTTEVTTPAFGIPAAPTYVSNTVTGTGYDVDYAVSFVIGGQESDYLVSATGKIPISTGEKNTLVFRVVGGAAIASSITEMKVYRRPRSGGAFGYVGSSSSFATTGADRDGTFVDVGSAADYANSPPSINVTLKLRGLTGPSALLPRTGVIYQQRLLVSSYTGIETSRTGFKWNFYRDYPLASDSSLSFKAGSSGNAAVLYMIESDGLIVFTSKGVYYSAGPLTPSNLTLEKKGKWVIDWRIPPIAIPGGVLFVDSSTNVIRRLLFTQEQNGFLGQEMSVFSDHLFTGKSITSWAFEEGDVSLLWVVFNDGTFASFTFEADQEMRAWTRHDTANVNVEYVAAMVPGSSQWFGYRPTLAHAIFVVEKDGWRYIETTIPRYVSPTIKSANPEYDKNESCAPLDSMVSWQHLLNDDLVGGDEFLIMPETPDEWEGPLKITCGTSALFPAAGLGAVGTVFRYFDPSDGSAVDLKVTSRTSDNEVVVEAVGAFFPSDNAVNPRLYETKSTFDGLDHLTGEEVSVVVDGYVIGSPNNDIERYQLFEVVGGSITLPDDMLGAIVHIGRPITADVGTLDIDTVEQRPVLLESGTVNKLYVKFHKSHGIYAGNKFPKYDKVKGMEDLDSISVDYEEDDEVIGNRPQPPNEKRIEVTLAGDWKSNGRICLRNVDPVHFEILSIIPDLEDLRR